MMQTATKKMLSVLVSALALVALAMTPALAKDSQKKKSSHSPTKAAAKAAGHHDEKPGPAWMTFGGTVKKVEGNTYTVEDYEGNHVNLYVGQGTKQIKPKKVGDTVRAEITQSGFANSIQ
ncbi:MAG: hypothetical protein H7Y39_04550 [Nitrospiraceae bacterium]|nr:hypothetical protein [Nitrospiraceae bacterium]